MVITRICPATDIVCNNPLCGPTVCAVASARFFTPPPISGDVETMTPEQAVDENRARVRALIHSSMWSPATGPVDWTSDNIAAMVAQTDRLTDAVLAALSLPAVPVDREAVDEIALQVRLAMQDEMLAPPHQRVEMRIDRAWKAATAILALRQPPPEASLGGDIPEMDISLFRMKVASVTPPLTVTRYGKPVFTVIAPPTLNGGGK